MPETDQFNCQAQDAVIWIGLDAFRELSDWIMAANDHRLLRNRPEVLSQEVSVIKRAMGDGV
ncbi:MAG TPA: hypothetical protein VFQ23_10785, partial [Anaerolineales bacterium]|nr:hypothetical protein [Anaerolineales bacterium]